MRRFQEQPCGWTLDDAQEPCRLFPMYRRGDPVCAWPYTKPRRPLFNGGMRWISAAFVSGLVIRFYYHKLDFAMHLAVRRIGKEAW
ncbi:hypothetical protein BD310DRAFT_450046 [Dichomitus squalens]|uniref:Uncharacterized protein n=1 Tax=Dichomitus squalens TaxID=114155 RepID=A0A4Q9PW75_9APHY|nr:hypothetical protein BD310DRAFT_450046 [Dichomitus squalens]